MTAAVQNIDSAAYLPPPPSTSTTDAKGTSAAGKPATDASVAKAQGAPSDFQSELELQQTGAQETQPPGLPRTPLGKVKLQQIRKDKGTHRTAYSLL